MPDPSPSEPPSGIVGALMALGDLRKAMSTIQYPHPAYLPGKGPTAADNCKHVLDLIDHWLHQLAVYLEEPRA